MSAAELDPNAMIDWFERTAQQSAYIHGRNVGAMARQLIFAEERNQRQIESIEHLTGYALEQSQLARHDSLTGLYNRLGLLESGEELFTTQDEDGNSVVNPNLVVLNVDLDRFKTVNDTFGHDAGDKLLRTAAAVLSKHVRGDDVVGRTGGDEFIIVADMDDDDENIARMVRRIKTAFVVETGQSMSIGAVRVDPAKHSCLQDVVAEADGCMYDDKASQTEA